MKECIIRSEKEISKYKTNNKVIVDNQKNFKMQNSIISIKGENNIIHIEDNVILENSNIIILGNNNIIYISSNKNEYRLNIYI